MSDTIDVNHSEGLVQRSCHVCGATFAAASCTARRSARDQSCSASAMTPGVSVGIAAARAGGAGSTIAPEAEPGDANVK